MPVCVIMAGGRGTRFWPLSRTGRPKQLLPLHDAARSLLQETVDRVVPLVGPERVLVITSGDLAAPIREQLPELPAGHVVAEPVGRNTAPCAVLGVGLARRIAGPGPVALLPADHAIAEPEIFREQLGVAFAHATATGEPVTFGIPPTRPETGYGYLEAGTTAVADEIVPGAAFVEKPDRERAETYLQSGRHTWNSGIFVWDGSAFERAAFRHVPAMVAALEPALAAWGTSGFEASLRDGYAACPADSLDYAVMEKLDRFAIVQARFGWSDLGSWTAWGDQAPALADGNRGRADLIALGSRGNVVHAPGRLVALVGVDDLVVVDTGDAILVCRGQDDQRVKEIIARLEADGRDDLL